MKMKPYRIFHWDTFDNATVLIGEVDTLDKAIAFVEKRYNDRINAQGADKVDIVDQHGTIVRQYAVS